MRFGHSGKGARRLAKSLEFELERRRPKFRRLKISILTYDPHQTLPKQFLRIAVTVHISDFMRRRNPSDPRQGSKNA